MQIHEITHRTITEAGLMGQIGTNIATGLANKLLPGSAPAGQFVGDPVSVNQRQAAAGQMNRSLLAPLAKQMQQRWAQVVQQLVSTSKSAADPKIPATAAGQLAVTDLTQELEKFLNSLFGAGNDIASLASMTDNNDARMLSQQLPKQIQDAIKLTMDPKTNAGIADKTWMDLATSVQRAKSIGQFSGTRGKAVAGTRLTPQSQKVANDLSLDANQIAQMQQLAQSPAGLAALQQITGIKK